MSNESNKNPERKPLRERKIELTEKQVGQADDILKAQMRPDAAQDLKGVVYAIDSKRRYDKNFTTKQKLILAQVLKLIANSMDPEKSSTVEWSQLENREEKLQSALNNGMGQALNILRPMEKAMNQLMLWKANSLHPGDTPLPKKQTSILFTPGHLSDSVFRKVVDHELGQTNQRIGRGKYRAFMFLPIEKLEDPSDFVEYLRIAHKHYVHVLSSIHVDDSFDSKYQVFNNWKYPPNSINDTESQEILSHASFIANHLKVRDKISDYFEDEPLTVGLEHAMAAQMTRYYNREKPGNWYIPIVHPDVLGDKLTTVNLIDNVKGWDEYNENQFNMAYTADKDEESNVPGVRIKGATTIFPKKAFKIKDAGTEAVPLIDSQARYTRNRIYFYLVTECYREEGGQITEKEMRQKIQNYLNDLKDKKQIEGGKVVQCEKDPIGNFKIKVAVTWNAAAKDFEIEFDQAAEEDAK